MKTLGRILIIVAAIAMVMGITYMAVNAGGTSSQNAPAFEQHDRFPPNGGQRPDFRGEGDRGGGGWMFGMIKNLGIVAVIVALIALPKNWLQKNRQAVPVRIND